MRCLQNKEDEWKWNPMFSTGLVSLILFSRGSAPCQDHTSKGTGESVPRLWYRWLAFPVLLICYLLGACQTGKGSEEECRAQLASESTLGYLEKDCGRVGTMTAKSPYHAD